MAKQQRRAGIRRLHQDLLLLLLLLGKLKSRSVVGIGSCIGMGVGVAAGIGVAVGVRIGVAVVGLAAIAVQVAHHGHLELSRGFPGLSTRSASLYATLWLVVVVVFRLC